MWRALFAARVAGWYKLFLAPSCATMGLKHGICFCEDQIGVLDGDLGS